MKPLFRDRAAAPFARIVRLFAFVALLAPMISTASAPAASASAQPATSKPIAPGTAPYRFETTPGTLSRHVVPLRTRLSLELDPMLDTFSGQVTHELRVSEPTGAITLHSARLKIGEVKLKGSDGPIKVTANEAEQTITLQLPALIAPGSHEITLDFSGTLTSNGYGLYVAPYQLPDGSKKRVLATQLESIGARLMLPCFDEPAFRPVWDVTVSAPERYTAISNMPVAREHTVAGKRHTEFAPTPGMSSYLLAITVGELIKTSDRFEGTELSVYSMAGKPHHAAFALDASKRLLAYYKDYFGTAYPLPKLDQLALPGMRGAMENWGLIIYSEDLLLVDPATASISQRNAAFVVIAHEISHQWFGNLVTMAWWDGLWLNESFASWMASKATAALNPQWPGAASRSRVREDAMAIDVLATTPPIERSVPSDQNADELFDAVSYQKGQTVLRMVEQYAGENTWRDGLRDYMKRHAYSNATRADLWAAVGARTAGDVPAFANAWTRQPGFPLVSAERVCLRDGRQQVRLRQSRFELRPGQLPPALWNIAITLSQPGTAHPTQSHAMNTAQIEVPAGRCGDAVLLDAGGDGYFRVRYDAALQKQLDNHSAQLATADRLRLLKDAWALAEAGLESPRRTYQLIDALQATDNPALWEGAIIIYRRAHLLLNGDPMLEASRAHARRTLGRAFAALGWSAQPGEPDARRNLRGQLISTLVASGDDAVSAEARRRFAAYLADPATLSDGDVLSGVIQAAGVNASVADVETLVRLIEGGRNAPLEDAVINAFASLRDPQAARAALALKLTDRLPLAMSNWLVGQVAIRHGRLAWQFMRDHLQALYAKDSPYARRFILTWPLYNGRDTALAAEVKALAMTELEPDARGEVMRSVDRVQRNAWAYEAIRGKLGFLAERPVRSETRRKPARKA